MAKNPLGKTLLRNVIRHTDAHNKIQEETEMWKMRGYEVKNNHNKHFPATESTRGSMHCDRDQDEFLSRSRERSEHDDRDARYWTRKLYEFEDKDPDRWGHSGFKELYPEDFVSESEQNGTTKKKKKSKSAKETSNSKKSSRKKKKKKKKHDEGKRRKTSSDSSSEDSSDAKEKKKKNHKRKKSARKKEDCSSGDSDDDKERDRRKHSRKRRKEDVNKDASPDYRKKRRKAAGEDGSETD